MKIIGSSINALMLFVALFVSGARLCAQGTAFTYQGRLNTGGGPATGLYDFQFTVWDAVNGGNGLGIFPLSATLPVTNGLFTITLDPGPGVFTGPNRWLEIAVRTNGAPAYTNLSPRQLITATPYAVRATGAAVASGVTPGAVTAAGLAPGAVYQVGNPSGSISNAIQVNASGLVGVGTNAPQAGLHVASGSGIIAPRVLASFHDETGGYTNLLGASSAAAFGNLLAIVSSSDSGITLIDIADPQSPILLTQFRDEEGVFTNLAGMNHLALKENLLAVGAYNDKAVTLIGVTNPASPVKLAELRDGVGGWNELDGIYGMAIRGNILAISTVNDNAVTLADISDPSVPIKRVEMKDDVFGFNSLSGAVSVAISGNLLAVGAFYDNAVTLVDISDPSNPIKLSEMRHGIGGFNNLSNVYKVALSTNGLLAIGAASSSAVTLVDVSNPTNPVKLAEMIDGVNGINSLYVATGVAFSGNWLAAIGAGSGAVTLFDISIPSAPRILAVMRDGMGGFDYLAAGYVATFAGTNLVIAANGDDAATLIGFSAATAGIVSQGRVGIGTTLPRAALDVVGDVIVEGAIFDVNANRIELGVGSTASGTNAVAIGQDALATGTGATAMGRGTKAIGDYATAFGYFTEARGNYSLAAGNTTKALGAFSVALGGFNTARGDDSFVMGSDNIASGDFSVAMGFQNLASGSSAVALGYENMARGFASIAMGYKSDAFGEYAVALGYLNTANTNSMAVGSRANADHIGSFVWADDSVPASFASTTSNQFLIRAANGVGINTNRTTNVALNVRGNVTVNGTITATNFSGRFTGNGVGLTNLPTMASYVFAYDTTTQAAAVAGTFQDITFNNNAQINGWTHTAGTAGFTVPQTGLYLVQYGAETDTAIAGASIVSLRATLGGTEINGSQASSEPDAAGVAVPVSKSFIVSATAGNTLALQFTGTTTNNRLFTNNGSGTTRPSVSMTIIRIQ